MVGCSSEGNPFADAAKTWSAAQSACGTYSYTRQQVFFGIEGLTTVEITGGTATRRLFSQPPSPPQYDEQGAAIGSHALGAHAATVDELLTECESPVWCATSERCTYETTIDPRGVPLKCLAHLKGAAEDGTPGVVLTAFACAALTADGAVPGPSAR